MIITPIDIADLKEIENVVEAAFSDTPDSNLSDWFSFIEMESSIEKGIGSCLKCVQDRKIIGVIHAMQENPINGREGREKWVITCIAVTPEYKCKGIGKQLLSAIEAEAKKHGAVKIFIHINKDDERVIKFYRNSGYKSVGTIDGYYYVGSAIFLLKSL